MTFIPESVRDNPWVKTLVVIVLFVICLGFAYWIRDILLPFFLAFIIAYMLDPVVDELERRLRIGRTVAVLVLLTVISLVVLAFFYYLTDQAIELAVTLGKLAENPPDVHAWIDVVIPESVQKYFEGHVAELKPQELVEGALEFLRNRMSEVVNTLTQGSTYLWLFASRTFGAVGFLINISIVLIVAIYLLRDFDDIVRQARTLIPFKYRSDVDDLVGEIDELMRAFFRGHLIVCLTIGVLYGSGYELVGLEGGFFIGFLSGLMNVIPYLGPAAGFTAALLMGLYQFGFSLWILALVGVYVVVQFLEGNVLTPKIVGEAVGLHPVAVIFALMVFGKILGFLGLLLAIPLAAILNVLLGDLIEHYKQSTFYTESGEAREAEEPEETEEE
jgi:predicted PurR-regulated permease PerM